MHNKIVCTPPDYCARNIKNKTDSVHFVSVCKNWNTVYYQYYYHCFRSLHAQHWPTLSYFTKSNGKELRRSVTPWHVERKFKFKWTNERVEKNRQLQFEGGAAGTEAESISSCYNSCITHTHTAACVCQCLKPNSNSWVTWSASAQRARLSAVTTGSTNMIPNHTAQAVTVKRPHYNNHSHTVHIHKQWKDDE